jgi:hypothetical protein
MTISEVIQILEKLKKDFGDIECGFYSEENDGNFEEPPECYYRPLTRVEYVHERDVTLNRNEDYDNFEIINFK